MSAGAILNMWVVGVLLVLCPRLVRGESQEFVKPLAEFFRSLPFWEMAPNFTALTVEEPQLIAATLAQPDRATVVAYLCTPETGMHVHEAKAALRLGAGRYRITFLAPGDLAVLGSRVHTSAGLHEATPIELPPFTDDLAIRIEAVKRAMGARMPGTQ